MSQQPIPLETLSTGSRAPVKDNQNNITARPLCLPMAGVTRMPVNPFLLRSLNIGAARTLLLAIGGFATLLSSGCANGGGGERANSRASFISTSDQRQDTFGMSGAAEDSAFVDWTKDARHQPGHVTPVFGGRGEP